jgi:tetratricopeptide (TPR) repeat protein
MPMTEPSLPLTPLSPDPSQPPPKRELSARQKMRKLLIPMTITTGVGFAIGSMPLLALGGIVWAFWIFYYVLLTQVLDPDGSSTPSVDQHSNIAAMAIRGETAKAAEAYRAAIAADPSDLVACEQFAQLALRELKDYDLAAQAYREAERRATQPKRQLGYAILVAAVYRDYLRDAGQTMVELGRILARYPDAPNAPALRAELEQIKAQHFQDQGPGARDQGSARL